jgi:hypothetical protein
LSQLYPGKGRKLVAEILSDTLFQAELDSIATTVDAQLVAWKLHNAVSAEISTASIPFPDSASLETYNFQVVSQPEQQVLLGALNDRSCYIYIYINIYLSSSYDYTYVSTC